MEIWYIHSFDAEEGLLGRIGRSASSGGMEVSDKTHLDAPAASMGHVSFTRDLCLRHAAWAVDATTQEELPSGWRDLAEKLFASVAGVMCGSSDDKLVVRGLRQVYGGLLFDFEATRRTAASSRRMDTVAELVRHVRLESLLTCSACGDEGFVRACCYDVAQDGYVALCDEHALARLVAPHTETVPTTTRARGRRSASTILGRTTERREAGTGATPPDQFELYDLSEVAAALGRRHPRGATWVGGPLPGDPPTSSETNHDTDRQAHLRRILDGGEAGRWRSLARPPGEAMRGLADLHARAPHMAAVTGLVTRHLRAATNIGLPTALPALFLVGPPGIGKSWYLRRLSRLLGVPFRAYPMTGQTLADGLCGAHGTWRNAKPGLVAQTLLSEELGNPVIFVDEADKAGTHADEDPYRALYDLLEPDGARTFRDEFLGFGMDASRVIWVLAGNGVGALPPPILDRLTVIDVTAPDAAHLRAIATSVYAELNSERRSYFAPRLGDDVLTRLADRSPRSIRKAVAEAMTSAASEGRRALRADDVPPVTSERRTIGFR